MSLVGKFEQNYKRANDLDRYLMLNSMALLGYARIQKSMADYFEECGIHYFEGIDADLEQIFNISIHSDPEIAKIKDARLGIDTALDFDMSNFDDAGEDIEPIAEIDKKDDSRLEKLIAAMNAHAAIEREAKKTRHQNGTNTTGKRYTAKIFLCHAS